VTPASAASWRIVAPVGFSGDIPRPIEPMITPSALIRYVPRYFTEMNAISGTRMATGPVPKIPTVERKPPSTNPTHGMSFLRCPTTRNAPSMTQWIAPLSSRWLNIRETPMISTTRLAGKAA
jgi:hypothetical protein